MRKIYQKGKNLIGGTMKKIAVQVISKNRKRWHMSQLTALYLSTIVLAYIPSLEPGWRLSDTLKEQKKLEEEEVNPANFFQQFNNEVNKWEEKWNKRILKNGN